MSNGLFQWIREGVRQSVLQGVTDALESIGSPDDNNKLHPALMPFQGAAKSQAVAIEGEPVARKATTSTARKRLGRSLKDIEPNK